MVLATVGSMALPLTEFYARNRKRHDIAAAEWKSRQPYGRFEVTGQLDEWASSLVEGTELQRTPLTPSTAARWAAVFAPDATPNHDDPLWWVTNKIVARAVADAVLVPPEPGTVRTGYSTRDQEDRTDGIGWAFIPAAAEFLVLHASTPVPVQDVAGGRHVVGAASIATLVRIAADSLNTVRQGPERAD